MSIGILNYISKAAFMLGKAFEVGCVLIPAHGRRLDRPLARIQHFLPGLRS
jgi:hypothetical protein